MKYISMIGIGAALSALVSLNSFAADASSEASSAQTSAAKQPVKKPATKAGTAPATAQANNAPKQNDRLDLDPTVVSGNRELPKVMYIVPWKKADIGNLPGQPFNTLLDEALTPVDRDVFRREVQYYEVISAKDQPGVEQATQNADSK